MIKKLPTQMPKLKYHNDSFIYFSNEKYLNYYSLEDFQIGFKLDIQFSSFYKVLLYFDSTYLGVDIVWELTSWIKTIASKKLFLKSISLCVYYYKQSRLNIYKLFL